MYVTRCNVCGERCRKISRRDVEIKNCDYSLEESFELCDICHGKLLSFLKEKTGFFYELKEQKIVKDDVAHVRIENKEKLIRSFYKNSLLFSAIGFGISLIVYPQIAILFLVTGGLTPIIAWYLSN